VFPPSEPDITAEKVDTLLIDSNNDGNANPGETLQYTIEIANTSEEADAAELLFSDTPDANTTLVVGSVVANPGTVLTGNGAGDTSVEVFINRLEPGASSIITFAVTINDPLPADVTEVANQGIVTGDGIPETPTDDPDTPEPDDPTRTPVVLTPIVEALKTDTLLFEGDNDGLAEPGDTLQYTIEVANTGEGDATNVIFTDTPDANTTLVVGSVTTTQGTITSGNTAGDTSVGVNIGTLAAGNSVNITFRVTINNPLPTNVTEVTNQGIVTGGNIPETPTDDPDTPTPDDPTRTPVVLTPIVDALKTDALSIDANDDGLASPDDQVRYTITVFNTGNTDALNVVFTDTPDPRTTLVVGSVTTTKGTIISGNTAGDTSVGVNIGTLAAGETVEIVFDVAVTGLGEDPNSEPDLENQGFFTGGNIPDTPTDDPDTLEIDDPTRTPVGDEDPRFIELVSFTATLRGQNAIDVRWETGLEINSWGFHLLRSSDGTRANAERVTTELIPARGNSTSGATYLWTDTAEPGDTSYTYWLQEIERDGTINEYGVAVVSIPVSSADNHVYIPLVVMR
jgi:uncharacterized repeat protein (TIGR01451 family)